MNKKVSCLCLLPGLSYSKFVPLKVKKGQEIFCPQDIICEINSRPIQDIIDLRFYLQAGNTAKLIRNDKPVKTSASFVQIKKISFYQDIPDVKKCRNNCIFCFVGQLPENLRKSLYFKDDDWRLSFLTGNFTTLTGVEDEEIERIVEQRISPLYISVHAFDKKTRHKLGFNKDDKGIENLKYVDGEKIATHLQIVLCPGINDGNILARTLDELDKLKNVKSVGIVPVGLTRYHENGLSSVDKDLAEEIIKIAVSRQKGYKKTRGYNWLYLADEFYLLTGSKIPAASEYDDFYQLENGIGLVREFIDGLENIKLAQKESFVIVTGRAFAPLLRQAFSSRKVNANFEVLGLKNNFFGLSITVAGLLCGKDIVEQVKERKKPVLIPDITLNEKGLFLDNMSFTELKKSLPNAVLVPADVNDFSRWLAAR